MYLITFREKLKFSKSLKIYKNGMKMNRSAPSVHTTNLKINNISYIVPTIEEIDSEMY